MWCVKTRTTAVVDLTKEFFFKYSCLFKKYYILAYVKRTYMILRDPNHSAHLLIYIGITLAAVAVYGCYVFFANPS
jgi:hypothetical protein